MLSSQVSCQWSQIYIYALYNISPTFQICFIAPADFLITISLFANIWMKVIYRHSTEEMSTLFPNSPRAVAGSASQCVLEGDKSSSFLPGLHPDWNSCHQSSERVTPLCIMEAYWKPSFNLPLPHSYHIILVYEGFQGALNWAMMWNRVVVRLIVAESSDCVRSNKKMKAILASDNSVPQV